MTNDDRNVHHFDGKVYTGYPRFNFDDRLATDLKTDGVDIVSTANNHCLDRCSRGINRTLVALEKAKIQYTGTKKHLSHSFKAVTKANGISVVWLACSSAGSTLQKQWNKDSWAVLDCDTDAIAQGIKRLKNGGKTAVIVTPHWGKEYADKPTSEQVAQAEAWSEAGAIAVLGNHAHVTQKAEIYRTADGRDVLIAYAIGNFVSHQGWRTVGVTPEGELAKRTSAFLLLGVTRSSNGKVILESWKYVPLFVWRSNPASCPGCSCPKPLGQNIVKWKQSCHKYRVMAADKSGSSSAKKALANVQAKMSTANFLKFDAALDWINNRKRQPTPAPTPAPTGPRCPAWTKSRTPSTYKNKKYCQCKSGHVCWKGSNRTPGCNQQNPDSSHKEYFLLSCTNCRCERRH